MRFSRLLLAALLVAPLVVAQEDPCPPTFPPESCETGGAGVTPAAVPPPTCDPCYNLDQMIAARATCSTNIACQVGAVDPNYFFLLTCDPGGGPPPSVLGVYIAVSTDDSCSRDDVNGTNVLGAGALEAGAPAGRCTDLHNYALTVLGCP